MKCPSCNSTLEITGQERLETLGEHVSNPNGTPSLKPTYQCVNANCKCFRAFMWDEYGDFYCNGYYHQAMEIFPDDRYAAIDSFAKKCEIEIYKKGLKDKTYLHPAWCLWFYQPFIEYHYEGNDAGEVLSKAWSIGFLGKHRGRGRYSIVVIPFWRTWAFLWKRFIRSYKSGDYVRAFDRARNRSWQYQSFEWFTRTLFFYNVPK